MPLIKLGTKKRFFLILTVVLLGLIWFSPKIILGAIPPPPPGIVGCEEKICVNFNQATGECGECRYGINFETRKCNPPPVPPPEERLEVKYPSLHGIRPVAEGEDALPIFIKYLFYLAIATAGLITFAVVVLAGFNYLTSAGDPGKTREAREGITAGLLGLILLLGSVLLLITINPQLTRLTLESIEDFLLEARGTLAGVYLISDEEREIELEDKILTVFKNVGTTGSIFDLAIQGFDNKTQKICFNTDWREDIEFNAVLHTKRDFKGECRIFYEKRFSPDLIWGGMGGDVQGDVSSITVFSKSVLFPEDPAGDYAVELYKLPNFDEEEGVCTISGEQLEPKDINDECGDDWNDNIYSLKIGEGWVLAVFEESDGTGKCQIFAPGRDKEVSEIRTHYIGRCKVGIRIGPFGGEWKPCISSFAIFKGRLR